MLGKQELMSCLLLSAKHGESNFWAVFKQLQVCYHLLPEWRMADLDLHVAQGERKRQTTIILSDAQQRCIYGTWHHDYETLEITIVNWLPS